MATCPDGEIVVISMDQIDRQNTHSGHLTGIGAVVRSVVAQNALQKSLTAHQAITLWPQIAGDQLAKVCIAESVRDGVLFVKSKSSAWANELTFHKPELIKKLDARLGGGIVTDIHFSTSSRLRTSRVSEKYEEDEAIGAKAVAARPMISLAPIDGAAALDPKLKLRLLIERTEAILAWRRQNGWVECSRCHALYEPPKTKSGGRSTKSARKKQAGAGRSGICPICDILLGS
jgi:hypothetical protein